MGGFEAVVDGVVLPEFAGFRIHGDHFARTKPATALDALRRTVPDTGFRGDGENPIVRDAVACRPQPIAIEIAAGNAAIGGYDPGRPVPWFLVHGVEFQEGFQL